jgi:hypothetical protein
MSTSPVSGFTHAYMCHDCGSEVGFRSRRRNFLERFLLPVMLLQPVRCGECFRRDYRLIFTAVRDRLSETRKIPPAKQPATANRNVA